MCLCPQGFLSDLLEKANRHYDDQKLQEYTQTIVILILTHGFIHTQIQWRSQYNCMVYIFTGTYRAQDFYFYLFSKKHTQTHEFYTFCILFCHDLPRWWQQHCAAEWSSPIMSCRFCVYCPDVLASALQAPELS